MEIGFKMVKKDSNFRPLNKIINCEIELRLNAGKTDAGSITTKMNSLPFNGDGTCFIDLQFGEENKFQPLLENAMNFKLESKDIFGTGNFLNQNYVMSGKENFDIEG
jgi:hypothetical protein